MVEIANLQHKTLPLDKVLEFLIYFKRVRNITNRQLAEKLHYQETYISQVLNGHKDGGEKLLHALESFYLLDNLQRIAQIDRQIMELERAKLVLQGQSVETFYAERAKPAGVSGHSRPELNERPASSADAEPLAEELVAVVVDKASRPPRKKRKP